MARMTTERPVGETRPEYMREAMREHMLGRYAGWPSTTSGILSIISGAFGIILGVAALTGATVFNTIFTSIFGTLTAAPLFVGGGVAIVLGIVAVIGGALALQKRAWGMALAGAILSVIVMPVTGVLSLIFLAIGKRDFDVLEKKSWMSWRGETPEHEKHGEEQKVSASQFALCLKGIDFPAYRDAIVDNAKKNNCPDYVTDYMKQLPDKQYNRANEVEEEFGKLK